MDGAERLVFNGGVAGITTGVSSPTSGDTVCATKRLAVYVNGGGVMSPAELQIADSKLPNSPSNSLIQAKAEPPSSSNSEPDLSRPYQPVPACAICGADSTGIHFGVEACAACSAFFRRTVVLSKNYSCAKDGRCAVVKDAIGSQRCRACRFKKCLAVGMDRSAVQHRRDAIGKFSTLIKRETSPFCKCSLKLSNCLCLRDISTQSDEGGQEPEPFLVEPRSPPTRKRTVLEEFLERHENLMKRRKLFYTTTSLADAIDFSDNPYTPPVELTDFTECMFQLWRIEPRIAIEYTTTNQYIVDLPKDQKAILFRNFLLKFQAVEEPFLTWHYGGLDREWWVMPNRTYVDFNRVNYYFENEVMRGLNLDKQSALRLFLPSFKHAIELVGRQMEAINMSHTEMVILSALVFLDTTIPELSDATCEAVKKVRDQLFRDLFAYYETVETVESPEVRIADIVFIISAVRIHSQRTRENMYMLRMFEMIPRDDLFDEVCNIKGDGTDMKPQLSEFLAAAASHNEQNRQPQQPPVPSSLPTPVPASSLIKPQQQLSQLNCGMPTSSSLDLSSFVSQFLEGHSVQSNGSTLPNLLPSSLPGLPTPPSSSDVSSLLSMSQSNLVSQSWLQGALNAVSHQLALSSQNAFPP